MKTKFICKTCNIVFENEGVNIEYISKIYGPCSKKIGICPDCGNECNEYFVPKAKKSFQLECTGSCSCCGIK